MYTTAGEPLYVLPEDETQLELTLEELEEEYAGLMRRHEGLLEVGKVKEAAELMEYVSKLEELIADMEADG